MEISGRFGGWTGRSIAEIGRGVDRFWWQWHHQNWLWMLLSALPRQMTVCHILFPLDECVPSSSSLFLLVLAWAVDGQNPSGTNEVSLPGGGGVFMVGNSSTLQGLAQAMQPQRLTMSAMLCPLTKQAVTHGGQTSFWLSCLVVPTLLQSEAFFKAARGEKLRQIVVLQYELILPSRLWICVWSTDMPNTQQSRYGILDKTVGCGKQDVKKLFLDTNMCVNFTFLQIPRAV